MTEIKKHTPFVLIVLDGWGIAMPHRGNAISMASTPTYDELVSRYFAVSLQASGETVGLPWGEMGNSEVGHLTIGAGRVIYQSLPRIFKAISDGHFFKNEAFVAAAKHARKNKSALHLLGLVSNGGIHSSNEHLYALLEFCKKQKLDKVYVHAFLDGRDTPHNSGQKYIAELQTQMKELGVGRIASVSGRFYGMDRDNRWQRTEKAYWAIAEGRAEATFPDPPTAISASYEKKVFDEEFVPAIIVPTGQKPVTIQDNDAVISFNFRSDRCRQLTKAFILPGFSKFPKKRAIKNLFFATMTEYEKDLPVSAVAFPPQYVDTPLAKVVSDAGLTQLHVAETEKYPHVTFFFNGGREQAYPGEDRLLVPSPRVDSYDQEPAMGTKEISDKTVEAIIAQKYDFIVLNFANVDMVGHTGNLKAAIKAVETIDAALKQIVRTILDFHGIVVVTADHGNAEEMVKSRSGLIDKEHSKNPVPFLIIGRDWENDAWQTDHAAHKEDLSIKTPAGVLSDVAPTMLRLMGLAQPAEMSGRSLL